MKGHRHRPVTDIRDRRSRIVARGRSRQRPAISKTDSRSWPAGRESAVFATDRRRRPRAGFEGPDPPDTVQPAADTRQHEGRERDLSRIGYLLFFFGGAREGDFRPSAWAGSCSHRGALSACGSPKTTWNVMFVGREDEAAADDAGGTGAPRKAPRPSLHCSA